jgi:hypothetical protein
MDFNKMTKKEIDEYAESIGINLDRRKNKKTMISELKKAQKAKAKAPKAKAPKAKAPKSSKKPSKPARSKVEEGFWNKFKNFFN